MLNLVNVNNPRYDFKYNISEFEIASRNRGNFLRIFGRVSCGFRSTNSFRVTNENKNKMDYKKI